MKNNDQISETVLNEIEKGISSFIKFIENRFPNTDEIIIQKSVEEYLRFFMYCAISMFQENGLGKSDLDKFHKTFYERMLKSKILKTDTLLDYEKASRERYLDFFRILSEGKEEKQLSGKQLNALIAKEALYMQKLLPKSEKDIVSEIYRELFASYNALMLEIQLLFYSKK